jgi:glycosyltransferase involved in cell wall biosynthesis
MIPHGVDTDWFFPREDTHMAVNEEKITLLYVGRLGARKGIDLVIRALDDVDDTEFEFLIGGTGRHKEALRSLTQELDLDDSVTYLGYVPDEELPKLYSSADIFILPSRYEGFGLVLLEAIACGTPALGADAGGIPTAIRDGKDGYVLSRNEGSFTEAIEELIQDEDKRQEMKEKAIQDIDAKSWDRTTQRTVDIYYDQLQMKPVEEALK